MLAAIAHGIRTFGFALSEKHQGTLIKEVICEAHIFTGECVRSECLRGVSLTLFLTP